MGCAAHGLVVGALTIGTTVVELPVMTNGSVLTDHSTKEYPRIKPRPKRVLFLNLVQKSHLHMRIPTS